MPYNTVRKDDDDNDADNDEDDDDDDNNDDNDITNFTTYQAAIQEFSIIVHLRSCNLLPYPTLVKRYLCHNMPMSYSSHLKLTCNIHPSHSTDFVKVNE